MTLFDQSASDYDDWCQTPLGGFVDTLEKKLMKEVAAPIARERALDLGCGTGIYSLWLLEQGLDVTGIDVSNEMLKKAKTKKNSCNIDFIHGDIHALPFEDETFDLIVSNIVLEFTDNPGQIVSEVFRVLKPGGRFVCGFIGKKSEWGKMYREKGKQDPLSVFSQANFLSIEEVKKLYFIPPVEIMYGLYVGMEDFIDENQAWKLENEWKRTKPKDSAGYIVAKWIKK